jgi:hypothetical protein
VVHQRPILGRRARAHFGKRAVIEHARDGIAGFDHDEADRARLEIAAILAGSKSGHEAHGIGARGPSRARTIAPTRISCAGRARA